MINNDGFEAWRERKEPAEGKGMAIQSTVKFFTYLQENDPEEGDEEAVGDLVNSSYPQLMNLEKKVLQIGNSNFYSAFNRNCEA